MRFPPQFLDELRERLPVSEVVGRRVKLKKAGREWRGLSPFNQEKTPSFFVNDQKSGVVRLLLRQERHHLRFRHDDRGGHLPRGGRAAGGDGRRADAHGLTRGGSRATSARKTLHDVMELAAKFFEATLHRAPAPRRAAISPIAGSIRPTQVQVSHGLCAGRALRAEGASRQAQGVSVDDMIEAGLLIAGDDIPVPYDRFRDRVMFPITDCADASIAFGGRALDPDAPAKYLNSPETPLFHKGSILYNGATARAGRARRQGADRGRGLCRRDRDGDGGLRGDGGAARHRAHRGATRPALEDRRRADAVLRRRQGRAARGLSRGRSGVAADCSRARA